MKTLYHTEGILPEGFTGQISYTVCLNETYRAMDIGFAFDRQHYTAEDLTPERKQRIRQYCLNEYGIKAESEDELERILLNDCKTEIHTLAELNGTFIGCIHRQLTERHMVFTPEDAIEGCIPQTAIEGVLKVTLLVFQVLLDNTHYTLDVSAE